jgi:hypothetical protein
MRGVRRERSRRKVTEPMPLLEEWKSLAGRFAAPVNLRLRETIQRYREATGV